MDDISGASFEQANMAVDLSNLALEFKLQG